MVLSECRQFSWGSVHVHWSFLSYLTIILKKCWITSWTCFVILFMFVLCISWRDFFISRPQFAWLLSSQRKLHIYITTMPPWDPLVDIKFHGFSFWLEWVVVLVSRVSHIVFLVRFIHSLPGYKQVLYGCVSPSLNFFVLMTHLS